ncbi:DUF4221 family protein [Echinicola rosea]|uniref:Uncharacterized protein n=1 Tax=Echinicola rosea TaxID=1807691 RepID=A0ABQ1UVY2_9BACT|nr:DUF4221 family protein [Echinicola rosea]GGF27540.1 hypothetical protein GCM10011339_14560 [Echinicola rosea]
MALQHGLLSGAERSPCRNTCIDISYSLDLGQDNTTWFCQASAPTLLSIEIPGGRSKRSASFFFQYTAGLVLISNSAINELFVYDTQKDSLHHHKYESQITPNQQERVGKAIVDSQEEFQEIAKGIGSKLNFFRPLYDPEKHLYYRLTSHRDNVNKSTWDYVLTVFDNNLNMISENEIEEFPRIWGPSFVKNNMIYYAANIEDELAFVRAAISEE